MKIVYNLCFGGFSISEIAVLRYAELKGLKVYPEKDKFGFITYWTIPPGQQPKKRNMLDWADVPLEDKKAYNKAYTKHTISNRNIPRSDPLLVQVVEELGAGANGSYAELAIADIPAGTRYRIDEYDGSEQVMQIEDYDWEIAT